MRDKETSTKERFREFSGREAEIAKRLTDLLSPFGDVTRLVEVPERKTYDRILLFNGETKLEIQYCDGAAFGKYGDLRLDYISAFNYLPGIKPSSSWIAPSEVEKFLASINVLRWGKLKESEADTLVIFIGAPVCIFYLVSMKELQKEKRLKYFLDTYGLLINKKKNENWQSAFIAVDYEDSVLCDMGTVIKTIY